MDGVGNFLNILDGMDNTKNIIATYDTNNKLYSYSQTGISFQPYYDTNYNRTSGGSSGQSMNFTYDYYNNRLNSYTLNGVSNAITYDNNGNSLTEGGATYTYDLRNNLISYNKGSANASYTFNALGQRVSKTVGSTTTNFLYDETTNLVGEYDNAGSTIAEHIYLNGVPVGLVKANTLYYVHTDHLGTPRSITNNTNAIVWKWNNTDPFGGNLPATQTVEYNKRFPGQYFDNESKLHYNYYRTYNPVIGRYIQSDPLGLAAGFNTYSYVGSNPLGAVDSLGLEKDSHFTGPDLNRLAIWDAYNPPGGKRDIAHGSEYTFNNEYPLRKAQRYAADPYFLKRLKEGKDIMLIFDACDTGKGNYVPEMYKHLININPKFSKVNIWITAPTHEVRSLVINFEAQWSYNLSGLNPFSNDSFIEFGKWKMFKNGKYIPEFDMWANPNTGKTNPILGMK